MRRKKSEPKVGDKFIVEITDFSYGMYPYYTVNDIKGLHLTESDFEELDPYHEPTLQDHAKALQDNCEKISSKETTSEYYRNKVKKNSLKHKT